MESIIKMTINATPKKIINIIIVILKLVLNDHVIKQVEYIRGLYRYPQKMLGRRMPKEYNGDIDVLVFAAHQDDEVLGLGTTLHRHILNGDRVKVIYTTNGTGYGRESWNLSLSKSKEKSITRFSEAVQGLSLINILKKDIFCLGYPDRGTHRYIENMSGDISLLIQDFKPKRIYVHCIEGGHRDHDTTSFVVKSVCKKMGYTNVFEWAEYNDIQPLGSNVVRFPDSELVSSEEIKIDISGDERNLKRKMLAMHKSQDVEQFYLQGEAIRQANLSLVEDELIEKSILSKKRKLHVLKKYKKIDKLKTYSFSNKSF
ncbi:PIG-L family deacetylase [Gottfriedia acidiceleris]|uniref:PIG-L deacetylase family protein n=1 Tax=Gottfriedia acidiceleris TaxID=371036 RepID=UPI002FFFEE62